MESSGLLTFRRIIVWIFASGLFLHAAYVFGLSFYQGFIYELGFELSFFPVTRYGAYLQAYYATLHGSAQFIGAVHWYFVLCMVPLLFVSFCLNRLLIAFLNWTAPSAGPFRAWLRGKYPRFCEIFFDSSNSLQAWRNSYWIVQSMNLGAVLICIWLIFPSVAWFTGKSIASERIVEYEENLCFRNESPLNWCVQFEHEGELVEGRILLKNGDLLGVYTSEGALTDTMPESYYNLTTSLESSKPD